MTTNQSQPQTWPQPQVWDEPQRRVREGRLVVVGSARSCAATTTATALALTWPASAEVLLAELDPAGGAIAAHCGLEVAPGLATWAAAGRREDTAAAVTDHCQQLAGRVPVLPAPASGEQARNALAVLGGRLTGLVGLVAAGRDVVADCGRLDAGSPVWPVVEAADLVLLVCRPELPDLHALAGWLDTHASRLRQVVVVVAGVGTYPRAEIEDALRIGVLNGLPWDPPGLTQLLAGRPGRRQTALARAARQLAAEVCRRLPTAIPRADVPASGVPAAEHLPEQAIAAPASVEGATPVPVVVPVAVPAVVPVAPAGQSAPIESVDLAMLTNSPLTNSPLTESVPTGGRDEHVGPVGLLAGAES